MKKHFKEKWYWTGERYASDSSYAWMQDFSNGAQYYLSVATNFRARAVRRIAI